MGFYVEARYVKNSAVDYGALNFMPPLQIEMTSFQITNQPQAQTNEHLSTQQPMIGYDYDPQQNLTNANFEPTHAFQNASSYQGHPTVYNQALDTGTVNMSLPQANTDYFTAPQQHPPQANLVPQNFSNEHQNFYNQNFYTTPISQHVTVPNHSSQDQQYNFSQQSYDHEAFPELDTDFDLASLFFNY